MYFEIDTTKSKRENLSNALGITFELCGGRHPSEPAARVLLKILEEHPFETAMLALDRCTREVKGILSPSDITSRIDDGRPGADEAWALLPKNEEQSAMWTDEMIEAWAEIRGDIAADRIGARRSFIQAYERACRSARDSRSAVHWTFTPGHSDADREAVLTAAVDKGLISRTQADYYLPKHDDNLKQLPENTTETDPKRLSTIVKSAVKRGLISEKMAERIQDRGDPPD